MEQLQSIATVTALQDETVQDDSLHSDAVAAVTKELQELKGELDPTQADQVKNLRPAVERRMERLRSTAATTVEKSALLLELNQLRGTLNKNMWQPDLRPVSGSLNDGALKDAAKTAEDLTVNAGYKGIKYAEQALHEHPGWQLPLIAGAFALGGRLNHFAYNLWRGVTWPIRAAWNNKGKLALALGAWWFFARRAGGTPKDLTPAERQQQQQDQQAAETSAPAELQKLPEGQSLLTDPPHEITLGSIKCTAGKDGIKIGTRTLAVSGKHADGMLQALPAFPISIADLQRQGNDLQITFKNPVPWGDPLIGPISMTAAQLSEIVSKVNAGESLSQERTMKNKEGVDEKYSIFLSGK